MEGDDFWSSAQSAREWWPAARAEAERDRRGLDGPPDLALVDALARLQLAARRRGCSIQLRDPCEELRELLDLVGLAELVASRSRRAGRPKAANSSG